MGRTVPICQLPVASFTAVPASGKSPLLVQFTDTSTAQNCPILTRSWVWGDGSANGTTQNPTHTFTNGTGQSGNTKNFTVTLTVTTDAGSAQATRVIGVQK